MYIVLGRQQCNFCDRAKALLDAMKEPYMYIDVNGAEEYKEFLRMNKIKTVPQVFKLVGGYEELEDDIGIPF